MNNSKSYISSDNIIFDTKEECEEYEKNLKNFFDHVIYFDERKNKIEQPYYSAPHKGNVIDVMYDYIRDLEKEAEFILVKPGLNMNFVRNIPTYIAWYDTIGVHHKDPELDQFEPVLVQVKRLQEEIRELLDDETEILNKV